MLKVYYADAEALHRPTFYIKGGILATSLDTPSRTSVVLSALGVQGISAVAPERVTDAELGTIHSPEYIQFLKRANDELKRAGEETRELVPTITRDLRATVYPEHLQGQVEWHMFDVFSPIGVHSLEAATMAASCAISAAKSIATSGGSAYALCRPPGHHAHADMGGGYCFFNNAALAAQFLCKGGKKVAILDVDADHGNGTQDIFYARGDVLHISLHADPRHSYPYFTGHADERGERDGIGTTINYPLPLGTADTNYLATMARACDDIVRFGADYLVVALGVDTHSEEPNPLFALSSECFERIGEALYELGLPTVFTQEGGYNLANLGPNVLAVLNSFIAVGPSASGAADKTSVTQVIR